MRLNRTDGPIYAANVRMVVGAGGRGGSEKERGVAREGDATGGSDRGVSGGGGGGGGSEAKGRGGRRQRNSEERVRERERGV